MSSTKCSPFDPKHSNYREFRDSITITVKANRLDIISKTPASYPSRYLSERDFKVVVPLTNIVQVGIYHLYYNPTDMEKDRTPHSRVEFELVNGSKLGYYFEDKEVAENVANEVANLITHTV